MQRLIPHKFTPKDSRPFPQEIDHWMNQIAPDGLLIQEWDVEYAPEVLRRFENYVLAQPDRIHASPYLLNIYFGEDGTPLLFWSHRVNREELRTLTLDEKFRKVARSPGLTCPHCLKEFTKTINLTVQYPAWIAGGELETDWASLGFTYIPKAYWDRIYPEIKNIDWRILDIEVSARMVRDGMKALIHWDCLVNHNHVSIRPVEKSVFGKWVGLDKSPLTEEDKEFMRVKMGVEKLPRYHGWIGESMFYDEKKAASATRASPPPAEQPTSS